MVLFKRKNSLKKRIECLEEKLGYFYTVDTEGYREHHLEDKGYGDISKLKQSVEKVEKEKK